MYTRIVFRLVLFLPIFFMMPAASEDCDECSRASCDPVGLPLGYSPMRTLEDSCRVGVTEEGVDVTFGETSRCGRTTCDSCSRRGA